MVDYIIAIHRQLPGPWNIPEFGTEQYEDYRHIYARGMFSLVLGLIALGALVYRITTLASGSSFHGIDLIYIPVMLSIGLYNSRQLRSRIEE